MKKTICLIHLLALAVWAGAATFFNGMVATAIFRFFADLGKETPAWLAGMPAGVSTRLAGEMISTIFPKYFALTGTCALVALLTILLAPAIRTPARLVLVLLATIGVWGQITVLYPKAVQLRKEQYAAVDAGDTATAEVKRKAFFAVHGPSLALDVSCGLLALAVLALHGASLARSGDRPLPTATSA